MRPCFKCLGRLPDMLAALVDLLAGVGHPVAILFALHPFPELVGIAEDLLLLVPEPLELPLDLLACGLRLGGLEGRLQLFEPFVHVVLPLRQLAEAIEDLPCFTLFLLALRELFLLGPGRPLVFVAVFLVGELELLELPLRAVAARVSAALPLLARVAANHLKLACAQLEQSLIGGLFGGQGRVEGRHRRLLGHHSQLFLGVFHRARRLLEVGLRRRVLQPPGKLAGLLDRRVLRFFQDLAILGELRGGLGRRLAPDQLPGAVDDFLLQLRQLVAGPGIALLALLFLVLGRSARGLFALAEDLLEWPDLGEEHVARRPPRLAVRADVLGPEKVGEKLVGRGVERLRSRACARGATAASWPRAPGRTISRGSRPAMLKLRP